MSGEIQVLTETFFVSNESCVFTFDGRTLQWRGNSIHVENFIIVDYVHTGNCCTWKRSKLILFRKTAHICKGHDTIIIRYAQRQKRNKVRLNSIKIRGEGQVLSKWLGTLRTALQECTGDRPKNFLVFINPFSGRQNGLDIYTKKVKPIFDLAKIDTCEVVTKNRGDFEKVICSGVECYDGILAVGGDGTVSEIVNCLIESQMETKEGVTEVPKINVPIAIIPCGSTDCVAFTLNGTRDAETNALHAILGNRSCFDVCRATSQNGLSRFFVSVFTYGYLSDLIRESEKFRWMGPMRYNYAGLLTLLRSKEYYGQLDLNGERCNKKPSLAVVPKNPVKKKSKSLSLCAIPIVPTVEPVEGLEAGFMCVEKPKCKDEVKEKESPPEMEEAPICEGEEPKCEEESAGKAPNCEGDTPQKENLREACQEKINGEIISVCVPCGEEKMPESFSLKGRYFLIACANISCSSELTPNGIAPNCVPGDGNMNVVLFQPNSICDLYKIYTRLTSKDRTFLLSDLPFVTIYKTKQVRINVTQKDVDTANAANCDGELFHDSVVDIRLYEGIVQFFKGG